jgi:hypothetical protein
VVLPHLHLGARDPPFGRVEIDLGPFGGAQLSGANEYQRCQLERETGVGMAVVSVDGTQQLGSLLRLGDRGVVRFWDDGKRASQIRGDVAVSESAGNRKPEDLAAQLLDLVRGLNRSSCLDPSKRGKHVLGFDGGDREGADDREHVRFEPSSVLLLGAGGPAWRSLGQPGTGHTLEGMLRCRCLGLLLFSLGHPRVDPLVQQPARRKPPGAGFGKRHDRILPKGQPVLLAVRLPVGHAPEFCPVRHDLKIHSFAVAQRIGLRLGLGVPDSSVRQWGA